MTLVIMAFNIATITITTQHSDNHHNKIQHGYTFLVTLNIMTLNIMILNIMTLTIMAVSIMTLAIMTLTKSTFTIKDSL